ncbi:MAG: ABC transporter permease [Salinivirgaceae bacterium]
MKRFLSFVKKEFLHIFRDVRTLIIIFGIPVAEILIFGFAINTDLKDARIAILDLSKDATTQRLTNKLLSSGYYILDKELQSESELETVFKEGKIRMVLVYEQHFDQKLQKEGLASIQLLLDASEPNTANMLHGYTTGIINDFMMKAYPLNQQNIRIVPSVRMVYNPELKSVFMFVPGIMAIILILVSSLMTSVTITREKELGTMEVLLGSPLKPIQIILGKVTPYLLLSLVNVGSILLLAYFVFGLPIAGSLVLLIAECTLFIFLSLSLGILISTVSKTMQQAMLISMVGLMMPSILLSGFIFPVENMPDILYYLSFIMPPRWFIEILKGVMIKGVGFSYIWKETLILTLMTLGFIVISIKKFKIRLE